MDLTKGDMLIMSGEGTGEGTIERYEGARTPAAIGKRLSRERAGGDRWADAWIDMLMDDSYGDTVYGKLDGGLGEIIDQRAIPASVIHVNPAAILGRKGGLAGTPAQHAARAQNARKGGRPRRRWTMREIVAAQDCQGDLDYLVKEQLFPTDTIDWDDSVWVLAEESHDKGGSHIYEGGGYRLVLSQAEPQLYEIDTNPNDED